MRKEFGVSCIVLGICCLIASVGWIAYNHLAEENAQKASMTMLQDVRENISERVHEETVPEESPAEEIIPEESVPEESPAEEIIPEEILPEESIPEETVPEESEREISPEIPADILPEMLTTQVNGYDCIGILSIPVLELELPVLTDWSYEKLKEAPCRYYGSYYEKDFVIAAHNYRSQFGRLSEMQPKDLVLFTDISGTVYSYEVVLLETLPGNATEEMIASGFDLSLYTCTASGTNRITVRCNAVE